MLFIKSRRLLAVVLLFIAAGLVLSAGRLVTREDPLEHADAIYVLGGTWSMMAGQPLCDAQIASTASPAMTTSITTTRTASRRAPPGCGPGDMS